MTSRLLDINRSIAASAFPSTDLVKLPRSRLLARNDFRFCRQPGALYQGNRAGLKPPLNYEQTPLFLPTPLRRNTCAEKMSTKLMMSSSIASGQKTKAPVTKMGLTYWFLR
jgi:hypothetical protein